MAWVVGNVLGWLGTNWWFNVGWLSGGGPVGPNMWWVVLSTLRLVLIICAVWRLSIMLVVEDGPFGLIAGLRYLRGIRRIGQTGLTTGPDYTAWVCGKCMSVWMAGILLFLPWELSAIFGVSCLALWVGKVWG